MPCCCTSQLCKLRCSWADAVMQQRAWRDSSAAAAAAADGLVRSASSGCVFRRWHSGPAACRAAAQLAVPQPRHQCASAASSKRLHCCIFQPVQLPKIFELVGLGYSAWFTCEWQLGKNCSGSSAGQRAANATCNMLRHQIGNESRQLVACHLVVALSVLPVAAHAARHGMFIATRLEG